MHNRPLQDRRGLFGRVAILVERDGVRITREAAVFGGKSYAAEEIQDVQISIQAGRPNLVWLLYIAIASLTVLQALLTREPALWPIAGAAGILGVIAWRRRHPADRYALFLDGSAGAASVLETGDRAFAMLVHDAVRAIQARPLEPERG